MKTKTRKILFVFTAALGLAATAQVDIKDNKRFENSSNKEGHWENDSKHKASFEIELFVEKEEQGHEDFIFNKVDDHQKNG